MSIKFFKISILLSMINIFNIYSAEVAHGNPTNENNPLVANGIKPEQLNVENQPSNNDINTNKEYEDKLLDECFKINKEYFKKRYNVHKKEQLIEECLNLDKEYFNKRSNFAIKCSLKYYSYSIAKRFFYFMGLTILTILLCILSGIGFSKSRVSKISMFFFLSVLLLVISIIILLLICLKKGIFPQAIILYNWKNFIIYFIILLLLNLSWLLPE